MITIIVMSNGKGTTEKLSVEKALQLINEMCINNVDRMVKLEEQFNQIHQHIAEKHEEMRTQIDSIQGQTSEGQRTMTLFLEENKQRFDEIQQQSNEIMQMLYSLTNNKKEQLESQNIQQSPNTKNDHLTSSIQAALNIDDHSNYIHKTVLPLSISHVQIPKSHTIMIPSPTAIPTFSGSYSESPNQFLIRVEEYAETVYGWNRATLLLGISQFLRDTALEWYCQLRASYRRPQTWTEFVSLFFSQFNSPIRNARQEQEWYECKQQENETINEFLIRLRAIWSEYKPKETEVDLIKHLLCKMRSDLLTMTGVSPGVSLDEIILQAQKVEEILYHRNNEQSRAEDLKQILFQNNTLDTHKYYLDSHINHHASAQFSNLEHSSNEGNVFNQRNKYDKNKQWNNNNDKSLRNEIFNVQFTADSHSSKKSAHVKCYSCGVPGHFARNCSNSNNCVNNFQLSTPNYHSKNGHRALERRDVNARS